MLIYLVIFFLYQFILFYSANGQNINFSAYNYIGFTAFAIDSHDQIFVLDKINDTVQKFDNNGKFVKKWGSSGNKTTEFSSPTGITVDSYDQVFVLDNGNDRILKFDNNGNFIKELRIKNNIHNFLLADSQDISIDSNGNIYILEKNRIIKLDSNANLLNYFPEPVRP